MTTLVLHSAPDHASLCIRLALLELGLPFRDMPVDRQGGGLDRAEFRRINPHGLIPALETGDGPIFETAAILLWLADRHPGPFFPAPDSPRRGVALSWLFWLSNTLHPALRILFYPGKHVAPPHQPALVAGTRARIIAQLDTLNAALPDLPDLLGGERATALDCYLCPMLRWLPLYPHDHDGWFDLALWPGLFAVARQMDRRASTAAAIRDEGLGPAPFTAPRLPQPVEGSPA